MHRAGVHPLAPAPLLVAEATIRDTRAAQGTWVFLKVIGHGSREIQIQGNDFRYARVPWELGADVPAGAVKALDNRLP